MSGVRVGPSAAWMQRRLTAAGMRPISNVVDVSNYVMLELNQPNHAYDLDTLGGGGFRVRTASDGERMTTLDGVERTFQSSDLLICDALDRPIGVGGVMGGLDTEITDATTTVVLEIAWFDPLGVMQTAGRLGLRSEASARYERGCDPYVIETASARFAELLRETCPDLVVHAGFEDARGSGLPPAERAADVRISEVNRILGTRLTADELPGLLDPIGFTVAGTGDARTVALPSWRPDSVEEIDVIEEVARHFGYDRVGKTVPKSTVHGGLSIRQQRRRQLRQVLLGLGISEAMPNPFLAPETQPAAGLDVPVIRITNPLVEEESVLRTSLAAGTAGSGRLQRVAPAHRRQAVRDRPRLSAGQGRASRRVRGAVRRARRRTGTVGNGGVARDLVGARRRRPDRPVARARRPARHAVGDAAGRQGSDRCRRRSRSGCARAVRRVRTGRHPRARRSTTSSAANRSPRRGSRSAGNLRATSIWRSWWTTTCPPSGSRRRSGRERVRCSSTSSCSTCSARRGSATGGAASAYRLRLQAPDRNLTDADVAEVRRGAVAAGAKLGADLRG